MAQNMAQYGVFFFTFNFLLLYNYSCPHFPSITLPYPPTVFHTNCNSNLECHFLKKWPETVRSLPFLVKKKKISERVKSLPTFLRTKGPPTPAAQSLPSLGI